LARVVREANDGIIPETPQELRKLPGVGPYTAGAIATFAYEKPVAAVDTNVRRVISRVFWGEGRGEGYVQGVAERLGAKNGKRAWKSKQAIMELGTLVCVGRRSRSS